MTCPDCTEHGRHGRRRVTRWMEAQLRDPDARGLYVDPRTDIASTTALAEDAALSVDHEEWCDDPDHWVWDAAIEAAEACGVGDHP